MRRIISLFMAVSMCLTSVSGYAQGLVLPEPGVMVQPSAAFVPVMMRGLKVDARDPFLFDFLIDNGNTGLALDGPQFKAEGEKLIKYFLASLTIKEEDLWVNLSPYEKDRMIPADLGKTELGRDMLAQDYILKQLTASLIYPEKDLGKKFWDKVYASAREKFGTTEVPVDTFNKVWIQADKAKVLERHGAGYVVNAHLKVMLESDYVAANQRGADLAGIDILQQPRSARQAVDEERVGGGVPDPVSPVSSVLPSQELAKQILREVIIPAIETEVNEGANFAPLRQMFYAMILASWYKQSLKQAFLTQVYANTGKVEGVGYQERETFDPQGIYQRYLQAYKTGVFNLIKEETDPATDETLPRKYFSGGLRLLPDGAKYAPAMESGDKMEQKGRMASLRTRLVLSAMQQASSAPEAAHLAPHGGIQLGQAWFPISLERPRVIRIEIAGREEGVFTVQPEDGRVTIDHDGKKKTLSPGEGYDLLGSVSAPDRHVRVQHSKGVFDISAPEAPGTIVIYISEAAMKLQVVSSQSGWTVFSAETPVEFVRGRTYRIVGFRDGSEADVTQEILEGIQTAGKVTSFSVAEGKLPDTHHFGPLLRLEIQDMKAGHGDLLQPIDALYAYDKVLWTYPGQSLSIRTTRPRSSDGYVAFILNSMLVEGKRFGAAKGRGDLGGWMVPGEMVPEVSAAVKALAAEDGFARLDFQTMLKTLEAKIRSVVEPAMENDQPKTVWFSGENVPVVLNDEEQKSVARKKVLVAPGVPADAERAVITIRAMRDYLLRQQIGRTAEGKRLLLDFNPSPYMAEGVAVDVNVSSALRDIYSQKFGLKMAQSDGKSTFADTRQGTRYSGVVTFFNFEWNIRKLAGEIEQWLLEQEQIILAPYVDHLNRDPMVFLPSADTEIPATELEMLANVAQDPVERRRQQFIDKHMPDVRDGKAFEVVIKPDATEAEAQTIIDELNAEYGGENVTVAGIDFRLSAAGVNAWYSGPFRWIRNNKNPRDAKSDIGAMIENMQKPLRVVVVRERMKESVRPSIDFDKATRVKNVIRAKLGVDKTKPLNKIHMADGVQAAVKEMSLLRGPGHAFHFGRAIDAQDFVRARLALTGLDVEGGEMDITQQVWNNILALKTSFPVDQVIFDDMTLPAAVDGERVQLVLRERGAKADQPASAMDQDQTVPVKAADEDVKAFFGILKDGKYQEGVDFLRTALAAAPDKKTDVVERFKTVLLPYALTNVAPLHLNYLRALLLAESGADLRQMGLLIAGEEQLKWEAQVNSDDPAKRVEAARILSGMINQGLIVTAPLSDDNNVHVHSKFSYSPYYPEAIAYWARRGGLRNAGIIDHDTIAGAEDFVRACDIFGIKATSGFELRVSVEGITIKFTRADGKAEEIVVKDEVLNNPGIKNMAYFLAHAIPDANHPAIQALLKRIQAAKAKRNADMIKNISKILQPLVGVDVDYERDVVPLTQQGNATDRHLMVAVMNRMRTLTGKTLDVVPAYAKVLGRPLSPAEEDAFRQTLGANVPEEALDIPMDLLRGVFLKTGGKHAAACYLDPTKDENPPIADVVKAILEAGGIPVYAYLGNKAKNNNIEEDAEFLNAFFKYLKGIGVQGIAIMPHRNSIAEIQMVMSIAKDNGLQVFSGVDINRATMPFIEQLARVADYPDFKLGGDRVVGQEFLGRYAGVRYDSSVLNSLLVKDAQDERIDFLAWLGAKPAQELFDLHVSLQKTGDKEGKVRELVDQWQNEKRSVQQAMALEEINAALENRPVVVNGHAYMVALRANPALVRPLAIAAPLAQGSKIWSLVVDVPRIATWDPVWQAIGDFFTQDGRGAIEADGPIVVRRLREREIFRRGVSGDLRRHELAMKQDDALIRDDLHKYAVHMADKLAAYLGQNDTRIDPALTATLRKVEDRLRGADSLLALWTAADLPAYGDGGAMDVLQKIREALPAGEEKINPRVIQVCLFVLERVMKAHQNDARVGFLRDDVEKAGTVEDLFHIFADYFTQDRDVFEFLKADRMTARSTKAIFAEIEELEQRQAGLVELMASRQEDRREQAGRQHAALQHQIDGLWIEAGGEPVMNEAETQMQARIAALEFHRTDESGHVSRGAVLYPAPGTPSVWRLASGKEKPEGSQEPSYSFFIRGIDSFGNYEIDLWENLGLSGYSLANVSVKADFATLKAFVENYLNKEEGAGVFQKISFLQKREAASEELLSAVRQIVAKVASDLHKTVLPSVRAAAYKGRYPAFELTDKQGNVLVADQTGIVHSIRVKGEERLVADRGIPPMIDWPGRIPCVLSREKLGGRMAADELARLVEGKYLTPFDAAGRYLQADMKRLKGMPAAAVVQVVFQEEPVGGIMYYPPGESAPRTALVTNAGGLLRTWTDPDGQVHLLHGPVGHVVQDRRVIWNLEKAGLNEAGNPSITFALDTQDGPGPEVINDVFTRARFTLTYTLSDGDLITERSVQNLSDVVRPVTMAPHDFVTVENRDEWFVKGITAGKKWPFDSRKIPGGEPQPISPELQERLRNGIPLSALKGSEDVFTDFEPDYKGMVHVEFYHPSTGKVIRYDFNPLRQPNAMLWLPTSDDPNSFLNKTISFQRHMAVPGALPFLAGLPQDRRASVDTGLVNLRPRQVYSVLSRMSFTPHREAAMSEEDRETMVFEAIHLFEGRLDHLDGAVRGSQGSEETDRARRETIQTLNTLRREAGLPELAMQQPGRVQRGVSVRDGLVMFYGTPVRPEKFLAVYGKIMAAESMNSSALPRVLKEALEPRADRDLRAIGSRLVEFRSTSGNVADVVPSVKKEIEAVRREIVAALPKVRVDQKTGMASFYKTQVPVWILRRIYPRVLDIRRSATWLADARTIVESSENLGTFYQRKLKGKNGWAQKVYRQELVAEVRALQEIGVWARDRRDREAVRTVVGRLIQFDSAKKTAAHVDEDVAREIVRSLESAMSHATAVLIGQMIDAAADGRFQVSVWTDTGLAAPGFSIAEKEKMVTVNEDILGEHLDTFLAELEAKFELGGIPWEEAKAELRRQLTPFHKRTRVTSAPGREGAMKRMDLPTLDGKIAALEGHIRGIRKKMTPENEGDLRSGADGLDALEDQRTGLLAQREKLLGILKESGADDSAGQAEAEETGEADELFDAGRGRAFQVENYLLNIPRLFDYASVRDVPWDAGPQIGPDEIGLTSPARKAMNPGQILVADRARFRELLASLPSVAVQDFRAAIIPAESVARPKTGAEKVDGGIDLNAGKMDLDVEKEGSGVVMTIDPAMMQKFRSGDFTGLVPVILKVTPIASPLPVLGMSEQDVTPVAGGDAVQPVACVRREEDVLRG